MKTAVHTYRFNQAPSEYVRSQDDGTFFNFDHLEVQDDGSVIVTYTEAPKDRAADIEAEAKAHKKWLRDTKPMRDAEARAKAAYDRREAELERRCGAGRSWNGGLSLIDLVREYLGGCVDDPDYDEANEVTGEEYLALLEKIAPTIENAFANAAGFKTWAEFQAAYDKKFGFDEAEAA